MFVYLRQRLGAQVATVAVQAPSSYLDAWGTTEAMAPAMVEEMDMKDHHESQEYAKRDLKGQRWPSNSSWS